MAELGGSRLDAGAAFAAPVLKAFGGGILYVALRPNVREGTPSYQGLCSLVAEARC